MDARKMGWQYSGTGGSSISNISGSDPLCNGGNDGTISITASGGTAPLLYSMMLNSLFKRIIILTLYHLVLT